MFYDESGAALAYIVSGRGVDGKKNAGGTLLTLQPNPNIAIQGSNELKPKCGLINRRSPPYKEYEALVLCSALTFTLLLC